MATQQPHYSPKQVADALQASESSVKRWCDQGVIPTVRTVGGHRRITLDGLQQFLASSARSLAAPQALGLPQLSASRGVSIPGESDPEQRQFREALASGDESACRQILRQQVARSGQFSGPAEWLITDAMHGIGRAWDCHLLDAYQERRACALCIRLLNELRALLPLIPSGAPVAVGCTPSGDPYQLPTALVELALREVGWNAISLGSDLPFDSLLQAAHDYRPQLVWLSVSAIDNPGLFVAEQNRLAAQLDKRVCLIVGGRALTDKIRPKLQYTAHCDSLRNLVDLAAMMLIKAARSETFLS
jgi:excisionase family DNA binding protein